MRGEWVVYVFASEYVCVYYIKNEVKSTGSVLTDRTMVVMMSHDRLI